MFQTVSSASALYYRSARSQAVAYMQPGSYSTTDNAHDDASEEFVTREVVS